jgi:hypothetical protein
MRISIEKKKETKASYQTNDIKFLKQVHATNSYMFQMHFVLPGITKNNFTKKTVINVINILSIRTMEFHNLDF